MSYSHALLALACVALIGVIAAQDWLYAPLRTESVSSGLTGPYHWWLDASYATLSTALVLAFQHVGLAAQILAWVAAIALILTAVTATFGAWVDTFTKGQHELWHTRITVVVFVSAFALEVVGSHSPALWVLCAASAVVPAVAHLLKASAPTVEKLGVLGLCLWLVAWAL